MAASDEDAVMEAIDAMYSMCGNPGQEAIIDSITSSFEEYAMEALESDSGSGNPGVEDLYAQFLDWTGGREDKWGAVDIIMSTAWGYIENMFGFHDSSDEQGEGTGS